jgi:hypothetical protein
MSGQGLAASTMNRREPNGRHQMVRPVRRMVSAATLLIALLVACLVLGASGLSGTAQAASTSAPECIAGTGAPLPPALEAAGTAGCHGYTAPTPTSAPTPLALEPGALPVVQALPDASAVDLSSGLAPLVQTPGSREDFYWYSLFATKTEPQENCWQTGVLGSSSYACDSVGASYLPSGPRMHEISEQGVGEDFQISPSGDYCNYYRLGEALNTTNGNKQSGDTGYEPPTPLSSYQEGNSHLSPPNVCQAYETFWGQVLQGSGNSKCETRPPCGMQHYVSLHEQGGNDRPWGSSFGEPSLVISDDVLPYSLGTHGGAWGYLCPLFEDQTTGDILESCLEEWRVGSGFPSTNEHFDVVSACNSAGSPAHNLDQTITQFASGTSFAENVGSEKTFVFGSNSTWRDFSARITRANLENVINADRRNHPFSKKEIEEAEKGERSWSEQGCGRSLSTNPANYALIGIEQGVEGGGLSEIGASDANLQLWTEYTPLPPTVTTEAVTGVQPTEATLHGTVNPNGNATNYYFQYGETTSYGSIVPAGGAGVGSGAASVPVSNTITGLNADTTYHYRMVAANSAGTTYGSDQAFTTLGPGSSPTVEYKPNGESIVYYVNSSNNAVMYWVNAGEKWANGELGGKVAAGTSPTFEYTPSRNGETILYYVNSSNNAVMYWANVEGKWANGELGGKVANGTSPIAQYKPNGESIVYYVNSSNNAVMYWVNAGGKWANGELGGKVAAGTSPTFEYTPSRNGETLVYYVNSSNNAVMFWANVEGKWANGELGGKVANGTSPIAQYKPNGESIIYYVNSSNNAVMFWVHASEKWANGELGGKVTGGTNPVVEYKPSRNGETLVYYVNSSNNAVMFWANVEGKWANGELGGKVAAGTSPTVEYKSSRNGETLIYYINSSNNAVSYWVNVEEKWANGTL